MQFDICQHQITQVVLKAGAIIRSLRGLPPEDNITLLYGEIAPLLGVPVIPMNSGNMDHLPTPGEMKNESGEFIVPRKSCPKCDGTMVLGPICQSCADAENGKYKSGYKCELCQFVDDKSEMAFVQRLTDLGVEIPSGSKEALGIRTITDKGLE